MAALPDTLVGLQLAGYVYSGVAKCKCGAGVVWMITPSLAKMPFSRKASTEEGPKKLEPHWATCKFRDEFTRKKKRNA